MKRREFVTRLAAAGGALTLGVGCGRKITTDSIEETLKSPLTSVNKTITEPAREIEVIAETDVLVIGGGPAGVAAAIAAARGGAETYLVERYNHLGGLWTGGLVLPYLSTHALDKNKQFRQVIYGLGNEMAQRLFKLGMAIHEVNPVIDPEAGKYVLDEMIVDAGVKMLYHSWGVNAIMDGNTIKGVFIESKSGRQAVLAKVIVDCTGDGDVLYWAGEQFENMHYHIGLVHRLGNVDRINKNAPGYKKMHIGGATPLPSVNWVNMHGHNDQNGIDMMNLSRLQLEYRKQIWESVEEIKKVPGHEEVFLLDTASQMGVRMSRILDGEYRLTLEDSMTYKSFDDAIGISGAWTTMLYNGRKVSKNERPMWQIPYRSLLPKKTENLLVAGRCFCFEKELVEDTRIIGTCLVTGHGAGAAAARAITERETVRNIDREKLRKLLVEQKVWFG
ncbi:MAG: FAD-dependent oxidoreductase [Draconibacterium sp.]|nr:FAD-dependent oxidoreductase [Draconibacterium sp.]